MSDWGKGVINNIGWGQGANNDIGWGSIYDKSNAGETLLKSDLNIDAFIIEVDTTKAGTPSDQFQFTGAEGDYDVIAKQNGVVIETFNDLSNQETITLPSSGVYDLEVKSKEVNGFNRIQFNSGGDRDKLTDIKQWGTIVWSSFERAFTGCSNMLTTATDVPNLSNVNSMNAMFQQCTIANPDTTNWDTSSINNMNRLFFFASAFNSTLSNWDVSNVGNINQMFDNAISFVQTVDSWDVSSVTRMDFLFKNCPIAPGLSNWDVSSVTNMRSMFFGASSANPDTTNWDVSNVTDMFAMFDRAPLANPDTSNWDVSSVTNMGSMFDDSNLSEENLTAIYENWSQLSLKQNVEFGAESTKYNASGQAGRDILVNTYNWTITDGGQV